MISQEPKAILPITCKYCTSHNHARWEFLLQYFLKDLYDRTRITEATEVAYMHYLHEMDDISESDHHGACTIVAVSKSQGSSRSFFATDFLATEAVLKIRSNNNGWIVSFVNCTIRTDAAACLCTYMFGMNDLRSEINFRKVKSKDHV